MLTAIFILLLFDSGLLLLGSAEKLDYLRRRPPGAVLRAEREAETARREEAVRRRRARTRMEQLMREVERYDGTAGRAGRGGNLE